MWLVLFMTLASWAGYELDSTSDVQPNGDCGGHSISRLALGFLAKGPIAWIPLLTVLTAIVLTRDWQLARHFKFLRGILLMVGVVALWGIPALIQTHGQFFAIGIGRHVIGRSLATMEGHGASSFGMYLLLLPFYFVTDLRQLLSLVDQVAVVDSAIAETKEGRNQQSRLQRERNRQLSADRHRGHFCDLHTG